MNTRIIFYTVGKMLRIMALLLLLPLIVALIYQEYNFVLSFAIPIVISLGLNIAFTIKSPKNKKMFSKEGFAVVGISWIALSLIGALPFTISGLIPNYIDAFFETVSGFTTTGASIIPNIDIWYDDCKSMLFWRSFTHWVGGMGVLAFVLALLPDNEGSNIFLLKAESTGVKVGKLVSKVKVSARILYLIYFVLTLLMVIILMFDPTISFFDALLHTFGTAGTGGFGIRSESVGYYSDYVQIVIAIFMMIFGINFNIFYLVILRNFKQIYKNEELRSYFIIIIVSTLIIGVDIYLDAALAYETIGHALQDSFFQVSSIITTTGFSTTDFAKWSTLSKMILFALIFIGGSAGSTAGGIKVSRIVILVKSIRREIKKIAHPNSISNIKMDGETLEEDIVQGTLSYFILIIVLYAVGILIVSIDPNITDLLTVLSSVATCINNVGPGLSAMIGPLGSFANMTNLSKITLSILMLIGRLEIYPILLVFNPKVWLNK